MFIFKWGLVINKTKLLYRPEETMVLQNVTLANCPIALKKAKKHSIFSKEPGKRAWLWMGIVIIADGITVIYC